jgi:hypothetical protein
LRDSFIIQTCLKSKTKCKTYTGQRERDKTKRTTSRPIQKGGVNRNDDDKTGLPLTHALKPETIERRGEKEKKRKEKKKLPSVVYVRTT